jgi:hypothetical protein
MMRQPLMMLTAFAAGFVFSAVIDATAAKPDQTGPGRASARLGHRVSEVGGGAARHGDETEAVESATHGGRLAIAYEVKTAENQVLTAQKYTDGQAPVEQAPVARPAEAQVSPHASASDQPLPEPAVAAAEAAGEPASPTLHPAAKTPHEPVAQTVHTDYKAAMKEAAEDRKMLFIYFHERRANAAQRAFETLTLADREIKEKLQRFVLLRVPRDAAIQHDGTSVTLLKHAAFAEMLGRQGVAIVDLAHERAEYYGHVVSTFPFTPGKYYRKEALTIILDLPPGTLTQRTMIYAVRIHPESPASTQGVFHTALADEAKEHAHYQASILLQGHHSWESRFHRINAKLPSGVLAQEVVAESWPNEGLVEACVDCVHSWRQSPGHWGAVRRRHPVFGYDIKRGRNGIWYATGIFGRIFGRN